MVNREELKDIIKMMIEPLCFSEAYIPWEAVGDMNLFNEVVKEVLDEEPVLRLRLTEGSGTIASVSTSWRAVPCGPPIVHVDYSVTPTVRRVSKQELEALASSWNTQGKPFVSVMTDDIDANPIKMAYELKLNNIELNPVEIVYTNKCMLARCISSIRRECYTSISRIRPE